MWIFFEGMVAKPIILTHDKSRNYSTQKVYRAFLLEVQTVLTEHIN